MCWKDEHLRWAGTDAAPNCPIRTESYAVLATAGARQQTHWVILKSTTAARRTKVGLAQGCGVLWGHPGALGLLLGLGDGVQQVPGIFGGQLAPRLGRQQPLRCLRPAGPYSICSEQV